MQRFTIFIIWLLLNGQNVATAQVTLRDTQFYAPNYFKVLHYGVEDGLSQGSNYTMLRDSKGLMWFTSYEGLNRYDGHEFKIYRPNSNDSCAIRGGNTVGLVEDRAGNIWTGSQKGLNGWIFKDDCFHFVPVHDKQGDEINALNYPFYADSSHIWYINGAEGIVKYQPESRKKTIIYDRYKYQQTDFRINSITYEQDGWIYIRLETGFVRFHPQTKVEELFFSDRSNNLLGSPQKIRCLKYVNDRTIYLGSLHQLIAIQPNNKTFEFIDFSSFLNATYIEDIQVLQDGKLWLGSGDEGSLIYDPVSNGVQPITTKQGLTNNLNATVIHDYEGLTWINTDPQGIDLIIKNHTPFGLYNASFFKNNNINSPVVRAFYETPTGEMWIGTEAGGIFKFNPDTDEVKQILSEEDDFTNQGRAFSLRGEELWVGSNYGIYRYDLKQKKRLPPLLLTNGDANFIWDFEETPDGTLWISTDMGVFYVKPQERRINFFAPLGNIRTGSLYFDKTGHLYVPENNNGFFRFSPQLWLTYLKEGGTPPPMQYFLSDYNIKYYHHTDSILWLATNDGLLKTRPSADWKQLTVEKSYNSNDGFTSDYLYTVLPDTLGNLWMSSNQGIIRFTPATEQVITFDLDNGVQGYEFNTNSFLISSKGEIFMGGVDGFNRFNPKEIQQNTHPAPIPLLTDLKVNDQQYRTQGYVGALDKIELSHIQNTLEITYVSPDMLSLGNNLYRYQLTGFDTDWIMAGKRKFARYTKLPAGSYEFKVQAANSAGQWTTTPRILKIIIALPWWRTTWFYSFLLLIGISIIYSLFKFFQNRQKERSEQLRLRELNDFKTRLFTNLTHEIRTPLTLINGMIERLKKRSRGNEKELAILERNSKQLLTLVNQMLDSARIENGQWAVQKEAVEMVSFLNYLVDSFKSLAIEKEIALAFFAAQMTEINVFTDRDKLQKIISNLLSNALKYCPQYGEIKVVLNHNQDANQLTISVSDSGTGVKKEEIPRLFERFYQSKNGDAQTGSGVGLSLTAELVKLLKGTIEAMPKTDSQPFQIVVKLPIQAVPSVTPDHSFLPVTLQSNADQRTLLIVEDNREVRRYLHSIVQPHYQILVAMDGQEGVEMATAEVPDLIISDVMMPRMDGYDLCQQLKSDHRTSHIPIILLTAKTGVENRVTGLHAGADAYLAKPFHETELLTRLEQLVANQRRLQQYFQQPVTERPQQLHPQQQLEQAFIQRLDKIIQTHLTDPDFSIPQLCQEMTMSKTQLYRKVKALTGKSVALYIRSHRLQKATLLLQSTDLPIGQIVHQIGMQDVSYFARIFKQEYGCSPSEMRNR